MDTGAWPGYNENAMSRGLVDELDVYQPVYCKDFRTCPTCFKDVRALYHQARLVAPNCSNGWP